MSKFCFYSKNDPNQEAIGATEALSKEEAIKFFSLTKMLPVQEFLTIFNVKQYTYEESSKADNKQLLKG
jgi:hypothetical protein